MKTGIKSRMAAIAVTVVAVGAVSAVNASAAGDAVKSDVSIKYNQPFVFSGKVDAATKKCERNRAVRVFRKEEGNDPQVTFDKTDSAGKYRAEVQGSLEGSTKHYAVAAEKIVDDTVCKESASPTIVPNDELP